MAERNARAYAASMGEVVLVGDLLHLDSMGGGLFNTFVPETEKHPELLGIRSGSRDVRGTLGGGTTKLFVVIMPPEAEEEIDDADLAGADDDLLDEMVDDLLAGSGNESEGEQD